MRARSAPCLPAAAMRRPLRRARLRTAVAAAVLVTGIAGAANAVVCADAAEKESFGVRALQTRLMVAALTCGARDQYNAFVNRYRPVLAGHGRNVKNYFQRAYGPASGGQLDRYVTALANRASMQSTLDRSAFCAEAGRMLQTLLRDPSVELERFNTMPDPLPQSVPHASMCGALSRR